MVYIPDSWLVNPENKERVSQLFAESFSSDVVTVQDLERREKLPTELKDLGEMELLKRFKNGEIIVL